MSVRMPFGKYQGIPLHQLDGDYFEWLCGLNTLRSPLHEAVMAEKERRESAKTLDPKVALEIVTAGFRALAKEKHPDLGGGHVAMQKLNAAHCWLKNQVEVMS